MLDLAWCAPYAELHAVIPDQFCSYDVPDKMNI